MDLRQVLALVTGAAADIGATTARRLAAEDADTKAGRAVVTSRSPRSAPGEADRETMPGAQLEGDPQCTHRRS